MNKFSEISLSRLKECDQDLQIIFTEVLKHVDITIVCGYRSQKEQNKEFKEGQSKKKWPESKHNKLPSMAIDVAPYHTEPPHIHWNNEKEWQDFSRLVFKVIDDLKVRGLIKKTIQWGGNWIKFKDYPHWQIKS